jgi:hypothetical protein
MLFQLSDNSLTSVGGETIVNETQVKDPKSNSANRAALGAAAVGACVGAVLVGPITALVVAGAAVYATTRDDDVGNAARKTGEVTANAYDSAMESAKKHKVGEKISEASKATYERAKEIDEEYKVTDKVKHTTVAIAQEAKKINEKYDLTGHAARALAYTATTASSAIGKIVDSSKSNEQKHS